MGKRQRLARFMDRTSLLRSLELLRKRPGLVVFNYHRLGRPAETAYDSGVYSATPRCFEAQLAYLARRFRPLSLDDVVASLETGFKEPCVLVTFDDGYRDNYQLAFPILRRMNIPAAFFVTAGFVDGTAFPWWDRIAYLLKKTRAERLSLDYPETLSLELADRPAAVRAVLAAFKRAASLDVNEFFARLEALTGVELEPGALFMSWDHVRDMHHAGMSIGAHTMTHPLLARLSDAEERLELVEAKRRIEAELGDEVAALAYPVGSLAAFSARTKRAAAAAGYRVAFSY